MLHKMSKFQEGTLEGKCVKGPVLIRAQVKKSDQIHPLKVKEALSSVDKSTKDISEEGLYSEEVV